MIEENLSRNLNEIEHGKKLAKNAEIIWGWGTKAGQIRARRRADFFIKKGKILKGSKVLEIGCGTGFFTKMIAQTGAQITAIDISNELLEIARKSCLQSNVQFIKGNVENAQGFEGLYDTIYGSSILHHLDLRLALPVILKHLKPGGKIVFTEPNLLNPQIWLERNIPILRKLLNVSPDETAFIKNKLQKELLENRFKEINITPFDWLHPATPSSIISFVRKAGFLLEKTYLIKEISGSLLIEASKGKV